MKVLCSKYANLVCKTGLLSVTPHNFSFFTDVKKFFSPYQLCVCLTTSSLQGRPVNVIVCLPTLGILPGYPGNFLQATYSNGMHHDGIRMHLFWS